MRIGILTYHYVPNFGAQLQTLSTIGFIKRMGHTPILLHWYPEDLDVLFSNRVSQIQRKNHFDFADKYFPLTQICRTENELIAEIEKNDLDMIVTGSDALFKYVPQTNRKIFSKRKLRFVKRKIYCVEDVPGNPFFCDYYDKLSKKIPVVAFSVSSQNCPYSCMNENERKMIGRFMNNFKSITVRDEWTKEMVEFLTGKTDVKITPDPVFSFNQNCYVPIPSKEEIAARYSLPEHYALISFWKNKVDKVYVNNIADELKKEGITPVAFPMPESLFDFGLEKRVEIPLNPIDWYALIKYSEGYIGERMHPIVVCLHNSVPFYSFDEYGIVSRKYFGLKKTYLQSSSKTFHVVSKAGFTSNLYAYESGDAKPGSREIVSALINFNKNKCSFFSAMQQKDYNQQMGSYFAKQE